MHRMRTARSQLLEGMLHVNEDACILGLRQRKSTSSRWGMVERVLLTNLLNHGQPLIRYVLEDRVRVLEAACACGSPFKRLQVQGRTDDTLYFQAEDGHWRSLQPHSD